MDLKPPNDKGDSQFPLGFNKKAIIIASMIVGVLLLAGVSYGVYYKVSGIANRQIENQTTKIDTNQTLPGANINTGETQNTSDDTSDWKTYQDTKNGFEIKYPKDFVVGNSLTGNCKGVSFTDKDFASSHDVSVKKMVDFHIFVGENSESCVKGHFSSPAGPDTITLELVNSESVMINDRMFLKKNYKDVVPSLDMKPFKFSSWHITNNGNHYTFIYNNGVGVDPEPHVALFNQILSTFKFTDSVAKIDTSDWKTYKNETYGYQLQYPKDWKVETKTNKDGEIFKDKNGKTVIVGAVRLRNLNYDSENTLEKAIQSWSGETLGLESKIEITFRTVVDNNSGLGYSSKWEVLALGNKTIELRADFESKTSKELVRETGKYKEVVTFVAQNSLTEEKLFNDIVNTFKFIDSVGSTVKDVFIENGTVYYTNENGEKKVVARSINDFNIPEKDITYEKAELPPNKKFILFGSKG